MLDGVQERRSLTAGGDDWPPIKGVLSFILHSGYLVPFVTFRRSGRGGVRSGGPLFWCPFFYPYIGDLWRVTRFFLGGCGWWDPSALVPYPLSLVTVPKSKAKKKGPVWAPIFAAVVVLLFLHGFSFLFALLRLFVCFG
jgi:hypothetical protein